MYLDPQFDFFLWVILLLYAGLKQKVSCFVLFQCLPMWTASSFDLSIDSKVDLREEKAPYVRTHFSIRSR